MQFLLQRQAYSGLFLPGALWQAAPFKELVHLGHIINFVGRVAQHHYPFSCRGSEGMPPPHSDARHLRPFPSWLEACWFYRSLQRTSFWFTGFPLRTFQFHWFLLSFSLFLFLCLLWVEFALHPVSYGGSLLVLDVSSFLTYAFSAINSSLGTASAAPHKFLYVVI